MTKLEATLKQLESAVSRLNEVLKKPESDIVRDSAIKRFEFTLDLSWKALKAYLEECKGIICASPKECFREGYRQGILNYDEEWLELVDLRNQTAHIYNEAMSKKVFKQLPNAAKHFENLLSSLKK